MILRLMRRENKLESLEEETLHLRKKLKKSQQIEKQLQVELLLRTTERDLLKWRLNG